VSVEVTPRGKRGAAIPRAPGWLAAVFAGLSDVVFDLFGKQMRVQRRPLLRLETRGGRSGRTRRAVLCWFPDRDGSWLIVASLAGAARHPAWFHNLARDPDRAWVEFPGAERIRVRAESLRATEREEAWTRVIALAPGYAKYQEQTDRIIPVVRLKRVS